MQNMFTLHTQTRIPTPYFCTGQESESESVSNNVNEPLVTRGRSHHMKAKMVAIRLKPRLYVLSTYHLQVSSVQSFWCCLHKKIEGAARNIGDVDGTCKQGLTTYGIRMKSSFSLITQSWQCWQIC